MKAAYVIALVNVKYSENKRRAAYVIKQKFPVSVCVEQKFPA